MFRGEQEEWVEPEQVPGMRASGWTFTREEEEPTDPATLQTSIPGIPGVPGGAPENVPGVDAPQAPKFNQEQLDSMDLGEIRALARDNNIEKWDTGQRKRLVEDLLNVNGT